MAQQIVNGANRLISIDGGGTRGIIPATVLSEIEERTGARISELFDAKAGTSTGGILAIGLSLPAPPSADEMKDLYINRATDIFSRPGLLSKVVKSGATMAVAGGVGGSILGPASAIGGFVGGLVGGTVSAIVQNAVAKKIPDTHRYDPESLESLLKGRMREDTNFENLTGEVFIASHNTESNRPVFFYSGNESMTNGPRHNHLTESFGQPLMGSLKAWEVARATSAAPTFFPPFGIYNYGETRNSDGGIPLNRIDGQTENVVLETYIDGGVSFNSPAQAAVNFLGLETPLIVSLGTGFVNSGFGNREAHGGAMFWAARGWEMDHAGSGPAVHEALTARRDIDNDIYYRFDIELPREIPLDATSREDIETLVATGRDLVSQERQGRLGELCERLDPRT